MRSLLEMMVIEYAYKRESTQDVLKPLALAFLVQIARQVLLLRPEPAPERLAERIARYMSEHVDTVTLRDVAARFSYHPNYISTLLRKELGRSFSQILLEQRMNRAVILLKGTTLPIDEVAAMLGCSNSSNFHKAFRGYYGDSPRAYAAG